MGRRLIVQIALDFVSGFNDFNRFLAVRLEISDPFQRAFEKPLYNVRMLLHKREPARDRREPDHGKVVHVDNLEACASRKEIRWRSDKSGIGFTVPHAFPEILARHSLKLALILQAILADE